MRGKVSVVEKQPQTGSEDPRPDPTSRAPVVPLEDAHRDEGTEDAKRVEELTDQWRQTYTTWGVVYH